MPFAGAAVPGAQPPAVVVEGTQFTVPIGPGVAGRVATVGVKPVVGVVTAPGGEVVAPVGAVGVTPGVVVWEDAALPGTVPVVVPGIAPVVPPLAGTPALLPAVVPLVCAPAARVARNVHVSAKHAMAINAPPFRNSLCFMSVLPPIRVRNCQRLPSENVRGKEGLLRIANTPRATKSAPPWATRFAGK